jgi:hypothetical protein
MLMRSWWDRGLIVQQSYTLEDNGFANCQVENESDDDLQWRRRGYGEEEENFCILCTHFHMQSTNIGLLRLSSIITSLALGLWAFWPTDTCKSLHKPKPADHWRAFNSAKKPITLEKSSLGGNIIKALEYLRA